MSAADDYADDDYADQTCFHDHDEECEDEYGYSRCSHQHCFACGGCQCPGYCDDYQTYNLRPAETGGDQRSAAEPMGFYARASRYLGTRIDYFTWQENPRLRHRLTPAQWRRLQHKGRSPRGTAVYYQHAPGKGRPTPRQRRARTAS